MQKLLRIFFAAALLGALAPGGALAAPARSGASDLAGVDADSCPVVRLKHWKASTHEEKLAFLLGFATMLEIEQEWQGEPPLPIGKSLNSGWIKALAGKSLGDLSGALDDYAKQHPDQMEDSVIEVLGRLYVRPALTPSELKIAGDRYDRLKKKR